MFLLSTSSILRRIIPGCLGRKKFFLAKLLLFVVRCLFPLRNAVRDKRQLFADDWYLIQKSDSLSWPDDAIWLLWMSILALASLHIVSGDLYIDPPSDTDTENKSGVFKVDPSSILFL